jgi:hypothetical protein
MSHVRVHGSGGPNATRGVFAEVPHHRGLFEVGHPFGPRAFYSHAGDVRRLAGGRSRPSSGRGGESLATLEPDRMGRDAAQGDIHTNVRSGGSGKAALRQDKYSVARIKRLAI